MCFTVPHFRQTISTLRPLFPALLRAPVKDPMNSSPTQPDTEVAARLRVALGRLNRQLLQRQSEASFAQLSALFVIEKWGPIRIGDLAQKEKVAAPSMTRTLSGLVAAGWVQREPDPDDGRSFMVTLTPGGAALIAKVRKQRTAALVQGMERLTGAQLEALHAAVPVLEQLANEVEPKARPVL
jgi:DNA-binding MarR family transcriptional regulator